MDICKCIVPPWHGGTLKRYRASSRLVSLVVGEERCPPVYPGSLKIGMNLGQIVLSPAWCSKLSLTTGVHLDPCHDEFRGPCSDVTVYQVFEVYSATNNVCTHKETSSHHETELVCSVCGDKQMITNSEEQIVFFRRYGIK
ncbi:hypothetical protein TNCV_2563451 [Trichonephila clavipes]|nr:hypothetical protein TNCV_2563451 [Trichonephila clavipes]